MSKIDWARKLSSRKFWALLAALAVAAMAALGADSAAAEHVAGVIGWIGACVAYIFAEGIADAAGAGASAEARKEGGADV